MTAATDRTHSGKTVSLTLAHLPPTYTLHVTLFNPVRNAADLRAQLLQSNPAFEYAFVDAAAILSPAHLLAACFRAVNDHANGRLRTRNVHSEIVFALSPTNNIADSYRTFGVTDATAALLAVKVSTPDAPVAADAVAAHLAASVDGEQVEFCDEQTQKCCDLARVRKAYKLGEAGADARRKRKKGEVNGHHAPAEQQTTETGQSLQRSEMEVLAMGMMAVKGS